MPTTILGLPTLEAAQNQKYLTSNQALSYVDALINLTVFNRTTTTPPGSPSEGDRYVVAATATGAWTGEENNIAVYVGTDWVFFAPSEGWQAYDQGANERITWDGSSWTVFSLNGPFLSVDGTAGVPAYSFSSDSDTGMYLNAAGELAFSAGGNERLKITTTQPIFTAEFPVFNHAGSSVNATFNKSAVADDAAFTFQTGFSTRALLGLLANDDFTFKVSPDGTTFYDAIVIDKDNGEVSLGNFKFDQDQTVGSGQDNYVLTYDHTAGLIGLEEASSGSGGKLLQSLLATYTTYSSFTATIPYDDTIPQNTEGTEILTQAITPTNASNKIRVTVMLAAACSTSRHLIAALFKDSGADAIATAYSTTGDVGRQEVICFTYEETAGSTSARTYKLRIGLPLSTIYINGSTAARTFGGTSGTTLLVEEIAA